jgi:hypothetical protein
MDELRVRPEIGTVAGAAAAVKALLAFDRVLVLDDLWTAFVSSLDPQDRQSIERQVDELGELVDELQVALGAIIEPATELRMVLDSAEALEPDFDSQASELLASNPNLSEGLSDLLSTDITEVGLRGATIFACDYVIREGEAESSLLREKFERLKAGGDPDPDLRPCFRCALYLAKIGGGVTAATCAVIVSHGTVVLVGAVGGLTQRITSGFLGWKDSGCAECWPEIHGGRL